MITISHTPQPPIAKIWLTLSQSTGIRFRPLSTKPGMTIVFGPGWNKGLLNSMSTKRRKPSFMLSNQTGIVQRPRLNLPGKLSKTGSSIRISPPSNLDEELTFCCRWGESHLKAFLDRHGIRCPQPRTRDQLIAKARENYEIIRQSIGETAAIPGNWLYHVWSDSDLKSWCDYRGIPVPQGSKRNEVRPCIHKV